MAQAMSLVGVTSTSSINRKQLHPTLIN